jgi:hypothetical protein
MNSCDVANCFERKRDGTLEVTVANSCVSIAITGER